MAGPRAAWGIDMGQCAMKALKLRVGESGKVEALASDYIEHHRILSQPDADRKGMIRAALEEFLGRNEIGKDAVVVSVPGQQTLARFTKLPPVEKKKIPAIVRFEAGQQIPFDIDDVIWDYQTFTEEGSPEVAVGIFAMRRELIGDHLLHYANAQIEPAVVQSNPLALYNALYFDGRIDEKATVILDIGAENTDLIIAEGKSLWTRTIPLGGNSFTEALVKAFKLKFSKAENLKRTAATSKYARQVFQAMRPVFADLVAEVQRSIGFYSSSHRDSEMARIIAMGNAFKLPGLQKFLQQNLDLEVKRPSNFNNLDAISSTSSPVLVDNLLSFGVAYGLALQGLGLTQITSNLLPPEIAKQVIWRKKRSWFIGAAACLLLSSGVVWARNFMDSRALSNGQVDRGRAQEILRKAEGFTREYKRLLGEGQPEQGQINHILEMQKDNGVWLSILQIIHSALPVWPQTMSMDKVTAPEAYVAAAANEPRTKRTQIFIERFESTYSDNVAQEFTERRSQFHDARTTPDRGVPQQTGEPTPGFVIELQCRTPHEDNVNFVESRFADILKGKRGRDPAGRFYVDRVAIPSFSKLSSAGDSSAKTVQTKTRRTERPPDAKREGAVASDPITGERVDDDYRLTVLISVALKKPPAETPAEGAGQNPAESAREKDNS